MKPNDLTPKLPPDLTPDVPVEVHAPPHGRRPTNSPALADYPVGWPRPKVDPFTPEQRQAQVEARATGKCASLQTANGRPCARVPSLGFKLCRKHGARAPQSLAKAERLLAVARMPAIEWILDELDQAANAEPCPECGYPSHTLKERKRLDTLAFRLLDRTGLGPRSTLDVNARAVADQGIDVASLTAVEGRELDDLLAAMEGFKTRVALRQSQDAARTALRGTRPALPDVSVTAIADSDEDGQ